MAAFAICCAMAAEVSAADLGLITAGEHGTYYHFGQDLRRLLKPHGINVIVHASNGAAENARRLAEGPSVHLGIVQSDIFAATTDQPPNIVMRTFFDGVRLVFPLFDEEVHIVARPGITGVEGLTGQRVAIGREGSGTYRTAINLFHLTRVAPAAMIAMDGPEAVANLRSGRIDAMVTVAGHPVRLLREAGRSYDRLSLVPVTTPAILEAYTATEIPAGTYPWQPMAVPTVAVKALLMTYDPDRRQCETIGRFARHVAAGLETLVKNGHPHWRRVDIGAPVSGWQQYDCVSEYLARPAGTGSRGARDAGSEANAPTGQFRRGRHGARDQ